MSEGGGERAGAAEIRWVTEAVRQHHSDVVSARAGESDVVLNFGTTKAAEGTDGAVTAILTRRVSLQPDSARRLRDLLRNVIAEADAAPPKNSA